MLIIALEFPKKGIRYTIDIGYSGIITKSLHLIDVVKEYYDKSNPTKVEYAELKFKFWKKSDKRAA